MATVNLNLSFDSNQINISTLHKELIEFNNKWDKIVALLRVNYLLKTVIVICGF